MLAFHVRIINNIILRLLFNSLAYYCIYMFVAKRRKQRRLSMKKWIKRISKIFAKKSLAVAMVLSNEEELTAMIDQLTKATDRVRAWKEVYVNGTQNKH